MDSAKDYSELDVETPVCITAIKEKALVKNGLLINKFRSLFHFT